MHMSNTRALLISLLVSVFAVILLFIYIDSREKELLEMVTPIRIVVAAKDIPEGARLDENSVELLEIPQKYVQPGAVSDQNRVINRNINVPTLKGTQLLESMFIDTQAEGIAGRIPSGKRAFSIFVTDVTAVGELILPGDMVDLMVTVEVGSFQDGRGVSEEIITRTVLENILVLAVNQTSSKRRVMGATDGTQDAPGNVFSASGQTAGKKEPFKTLTVSLTPRETQILNLAQEIGTLSAALRSSWDDGKIENLPALSARELLGISKSIIPKAQPAWMEIRGAEPFVRN
jgi:pilus assembly protein CpaB